ncbi:MAG: hypothetical protein KC636_31725 [Myxococcales bacterium]|nr:hypothetical protein [Myxococcales bacterium]
MRESHTDGALVTAAVDRVEYQLVDGGESMAAEASLVLLDLSITDLVVRVEGCES